MDDALLDRLLIREVIESWAVCRDSGDWAGLRACFHPDGIMNATWFQGDVDRFVNGAIANFERGGMSAHVLGGTHIVQREARAIAQTRVTIFPRETLDGVLCDIPCIGRFYDFFEKRGGHWGIVERQPVYERDRADPVEPGVTLALDKAILGRFPVGYRHLAYAQVQKGFPVKTDMPGLRGPEIEALYRRGAAWLG